MLQAIKRATVSSDGEFWFPVGCRFGCCGVVPGNPCKSVGLTMQASEGASFLCADVVCTHLSEGLDTGTKYLTSSMTRQKALDKCKLHTGKLGGKEPP